MEQDSRGFVGVGDVHVIQLVCEGEQTTLTGMGV